MLRFLFTAAILLAGPITAHAEDIASAPGWTLTKVQQPKDDNEFTWGDSKVYFALKPPDGRAAVTIDSRTADRIRSGEIGAEVTYNGQNKNAGAQNKEDEYVYGNRNNGLVIPDPPNSTLTLADGRKEETIQIDEPRPRASSGTSSLTGLGGAGFGSSGSSRPRRNTTGASAPPRRDATGASAPPSTAADSAAPAAAGGSDKKNPAEQALADQAKSADTKTTLFAGGITANNAASGFGFKQEKSKNGKEGEKDKDFIVWPNGDPGKNNGGKQHCAQTTRKVYDQPGAYRIQSITGCAMLKVLAWGAGGGTGGVSEDGEQHGGKGGAGAYVFTQGQIDVSKFDVVVIVGGEGQHGRGSKGGADAAFGGGGHGGASVDGLGGGGGGGFSGVFLVERSKVDKDAKPIDSDKAILVAAGGGGGSGSGDKGGAGGITKGGGNGASDSGGGPSTGNGTPGASLLGGTGGKGEGLNSGGGGGGGGLFGGGGGGGAADGNGTSKAGGGGSSFYRFLDNFDAKSGGADKPGNPDVSERGNAGNPGHPGKVILELY